MQQVDILMMGMDRLGVVLLKESKESFSSPSIFRRRVSLRGDSSGSYGRFSGVISGQFRCKVGRKDGRFGPGGQRKILDNPDVGVLRLSNWLNLSSG